MWSPDFRREQLNADYAPPNLADAFQQFAGEALRVKNPTVHTFRTLGRDGAIDLASENGENLEVYEAKHTEQTDFFEAAKSALREVANNLKENLASTESRSRFHDPWRNAKRTIVSYTLCFSCSFRTLDEKEKLRSIISDCFHSLAKLPHLSHIGKVAVVIVDWGNFQQILKDNPHLVLRWFNPPLPFGVEPFSAAPKRARGFHAYLRGDKLPYCSPEDYQKSEKGGSAPPNREELLNQLAESPEGGLVIIGPGGVGKTRLCEEVAKTAQDKGWAVLRVTGCLKAEKLQKKRAFFTSNTGRYLLLFDYLEDQKETFGNILELLDDWRNESCDVRFLANCRPSFERTLEAMGKQFEQVHLNWDKSQTTGYGKWVVKQILHHLEPEDQARAEMLAKGLPVLAVFVIYVKETFGASDLQRLLKETEFSQWMIKRMPGNTADPETERKLALLAVVFPIPDVLYENLYHEFRSLLDCLVADGWVVKSAGAHNPRWEFVHDILADELLIGHLRHVGEHGTFFVNDAFDLAEKYDSVGSAIRAFERIIGEQLIANLPWSEIFRVRLISQEKKDVWNLQRNRLLGCRLLSWSEREALFDIQGDLWDTAEQDVGLHEAIGRLLEERKKADGPLAPASLRNSLQNIIRRCLQQERPSLFLIQPALNFVPDEAHTAALRVAQDRSLSLQPKNHILAGLLEAGFPFTAIESEVRQWLKFNSHNVFAAKLLIRCCKSDDESAWQVARQNLGIWLDNHGLTFGATFVLRAALVPQNTDKGSRRQPLVQDFYTARWLGKFREESRARFVIEPWIRSKQFAALESKEITKHILHWLWLIKTHTDAAWVLGPWLWELGEDGISPVREFVFLWLEQNHKWIKAQYVLSGWLKAYSGQKDKAEAKKVQRYVEAWLNANSGTDEVSYVVPRWLNAMGIDGIEVVRTYTIQWLNSRTWPLKTFEELKNVSYMLTSWLDAAGSGGAAEIRDPILQWFKYHGDDQNTQGRVIVAWLNAIREPPENLLQHELAELARNAVQRSLEVLGPDSDKQASFILRQWLRASGSQGYQLAEPFATAWLERNGNNYDSCFIFPALLEAGGERALRQINQWLLNWLNENATSEDAGYLFRGALLGGLKSKFEPQIHAWLGRYRSYVDDDKRKEERIHKIVEEIETLFL